MTGLDLWLTTCVLQQVGPDPQTSPGDGVFPQDDLSPTPSCSDTGQGLQKGYACHRLWPIMLGRSSLNPRMQTSALHAQHIELYEQRQKERLTKARQLV